MGNRGLQRAASTITAQHADALAPETDAARAIREELPVHLIWGQLDRYLRKKLAVITMAIAPNSVVQRLPHCSHWPTWDDPEEFNGLLLKSVSSRRANFGD